MTPIQLHWWLKASPCRSSHESAIDLEVEVYFALWSLYLLHPGQAVGGFFDRKHFSCVLLHGTVALPQFKRHARTVLSEVGTKVVDPFLAQSLLESGEVLTVTDRSWHMDFDRAALVSYFSTEAIAEGLAYFSWTEDRIRKRDAVEQLV